MADWKSGSAPPPRPVRRDGAPPSPSRKSEESSAQAEETNTPVAAAEPVAQAAPVTPEPVAPPKRVEVPVSAPPVAQSAPEPVVEQRPADVRPTESRRSSIFSNNPGATGAFPRATPSASGSHRMPQVVSALETAAAPVKEAPAPPVAAAPVAAAPVAPVVTPPAAPVVAPVAPVVAPVQAAPVAAAQAPGRRTSNIRNQKMALSLPVVITHPAGKEDTRTQFVISRGAVVFLSAPVQPGLQ